MRRWPSVRCRSITPPARRPTSSQHAKAAWDKALELGELNGYRNAQTTVVAPTGTIGLVMDCDTTGIEPDFALVKFKKLAGGGYWKIINRAVPEALRALGYRESDIAEIEAYAVGHGSLSNAPGDQRFHLEGQGLHRRSSRKGRSGAADRVRHQVRLQQMDLRRGLPARHARTSRRKRSRRRISTCSPRSASPSARSRPPTCTSAAR